MTGTDRFAHCLGVIFGAEGGLSNDPNDAGGATNMGITEGTLREAHARGLVGHHDVRLLTRSEAATIYQAFYWAGVRGDELPPPLDLVVFDVAVNSGVEAATKMLQRALNYLTPEAAPIAEDGSRGPLTDARLRHVLQNPMAPRALAAAVQCERAKLYAEITDGVAATPARREQEIRNRTFLRGWIERLRRVWGWGRR